MPNKSPRDRIFGAFEGKDVDYEEVVDVLKIYINESVMSNPRYEIIDNELKQFSPDEDILLEEPYEGVRKICLLLDSCSNLAHIYEDLGKDGMSSAWNVAVFLRTQKDYMMEELATRCLEINKNGNTDIQVGMALDKSKGESIPALYLDFPKVGQLGWHFGREKNFQGFFINTKAEVPIYPDRYERKEIRGTGEKYTNGHLLTGSLSIGKLNSVDRNLVVHGVRKLPITNQQNVEF